MMELDVHINRKGDQYWGFRLTGGVDFGMPLTVVKVLPDSPADKAGLHNGDTVSRINNIVACDLSHEESRKAVASATNYLTLGVTRGLYDPILDDQEPIFLDPEDFDQPSRPTEVPFELTDFTDIAPTLNGYPEFHDTSKLSESRSLTASPFVLPTKPYRPFSTEPLTEVPPLEVPIILNPDYSDEFSILGIDEDFLPKTRFKLPISEQYDPDGTKKHRNVSITTENVSKVTEERAQVTEKEKIEEDVMKEIDLKNIELIATFIVDDSLQKAVTVTDEIKTEIDVALHDTCVSSKTETFTSADSVESSIRKESSDVKSEKLDINIQNEAIKGINKLVEDVDKTTEEIIQKNDTKVKVKEVKERFESVDMKQELLNERKQYIKQEIEETIEKGSVKQKSSAFDEKKLLDDSIQSNKSTEVSEVNDITTQKATKIKTFENSERHEGKDSDTKMSTSRFLAEQRAYTLGLKTIPNIRGTVHSSYHYDLLLKTFFIHLTDVMVALSRFILAEPVLKSEDREMQKDIVTEQKVTETVTSKREDKAHKKTEESVVSRIEEEKVEKTKVDHKKEAYIVRAVEEKREDKQDRYIERYSQDETIEDFTEENIIDKRLLLSGAEMAQLSEKKTEQLTQIMDAVISEFEHKAGIEESEEKVAIRERRSRSRSKVKDDASSEAKTEARKTIQEFTEGKISSSMSMVESTNNKKIESIHETRDHKSSKSKEGNTYYIATVESHVYTNTDAILEEQLTEMSSMESSQETNITMQAVSTEKVGVESTQSKDVDKETQVQIFEQQKKKEVETDQAAIKKVEEKKVVEDILPVVEIKEIKSILKKETAMAVAESTHVIGKAKKDRDIKEKDIAVIDVNVQEKTSSKAEILPIKEVVIVKKETVAIESIATKEESYVKHESFSFKEEEVDSKEETFVISSTATKEVIGEVGSASIKEEIIAAKEAVAIKEESYMKEQAIVDIADVKSIAIKDEIIAQDAIAPEEKIFVKEQAIVDVAISESDMIKEETISKQAIAAKEESIVKDHMISESTEMAEIRCVATEEDIAIVKDNVAIKKQEAIVIKEETVAITEDIIKEVKQDESAELIVTKEDELEDTSVQIVDISETENEPYHIKSDIQERRLDESYEESSFTAKLSSQYVDESLFMSKLSSEEAEASFAAKLSSEVTEESSFTAKLASEVTKESSFTAKLASEVADESFAAKSEYKAETSQTKIVSFDSTVQELTFVATSTESYSREHLKLNLQPDYESDTDIKTPTPGTIPPTPVTDEYLFKLEIPLPKNRGPPVPRDCTPTPEDEDPHIIKKFLVPHIDTSIEEPIIYDPPLPTPPGSKVTSPVYTKPGLRGGADRREVVKRKKEEILEIERKSSLLASAIDQTIKSIEEYKEEVGIEFKNQKSTGKRTSETNGIIYNGYSKIIDTKIFSTEKEDWKMEEKAQIESQLTNGVGVIEKSKIDTKISNNVDVNGFSEVRLAVIDHDTGLTNETETAAIEKVNEEIKKLESDVLNECIEPAQVTVNKDVQSQAAILNNDVNIQTVEIPNIAHLLTPDRETEKREPMEGYRPVEFNVEEIQNIHRNLRSVHATSNGEPKQKREMYKTETGEVLGTHQGIVDGLEDAVVDDEVAKELGKPGMSEDKIAELISGESEMLREARVMGLSRVLTSHMHRANDDDSSVDFNKIKPILESLKDSEVLKALNEELKRTKEEKKKKEDRNWTTFLQKPERRPVPREKYGSHGCDNTEEPVQESYKVKIVKQPKPKVAPDYKPENFETGLLPWEERAIREPTPPPVEPEDPILIPEEPPEVFEAVDPLPESEIPDLEDSGITLPAPTPKEETSEELPEAKEEVDLDIEPVIEEPKEIVEDNLVEEMDQSKIAEQLMMSVQNMVDPNASLEQQLAQMRAQLAALAQLPCVIQQSLELVTRQLTHLSQMESSNHQAMSHSETITEMKEEDAAEDVTENNCTTIEEATEDAPEVLPEATVEEHQQNGVEVKVQPTLTPEELETMKREEEEMVEEQRRSEKQKKEMIEQLRLEQESRQVKQHPTPRVGKPKPVFGPSTPQARPLVLPGGRKWRKPKDAYNEQFIAETLMAQAEIIKGNAKGFNVIKKNTMRAPLDRDCSLKCLRINFLKYEKPAVSLDHLQNSDTYKMVHNMEQMPGNRVQMRTPLICEADYREKCRSVTPCMEQAQP